MKKYLKYIPILLLIIFFCLFYSYNNGYYEKYMRDKITLTNYTLEEFENDIKEGNDLSLDKYIKEEKNYSNKISNLSLKVSNRIEKIIDKSIRYFFKKISSYVE